MPLPRPRPRKLIHTRDIRCTGYERDDGLWDIEGSLTDTKAYSFDNQDRGGVNAGEPIHHMTVRLTVDDTLVVQEAAVAIDAGPFTLCGDIAPNFARLAGLRIGPGWRKAVRAAVGGPAGCTHVVELIMGQMATTAFQSVRPARSRRERAADAGTKPPMLDTCHALASDSPVVARQWPAFYTGGGGKA
ncbi:MAG: DUF2889 domain-containing protein [Hyphomicrobiales bacterium]|nr:DUF2889 domain-containing protein [Hyphomicrobiales bacterium]